MGTVLSLLLIPVWMEPYMLFKYGIKEKLMMWYCRNYILQTGMLAVDGCAIYWLCSFSPGEGIAGLCIRGVGMHRTVCDNNDGLLWRNKRMEGACILCKAGRAQEE